MPGYLHTTDACLGPQVRLEGPRLGFLLFRHYLVIWNERVKRNFREREAWVSRLESRRGWLIGVSHAVSPSTSRRIAFRIVAAPRYDDRDWGGTSRAIPATGSTIA